jgi:hypothetical protein
MTVLKSPTGTANGISTAAIIIANNKYHPNNTQVKKQPPVATRHSPPKLALPRAKFQNAPAANPKPIVAPVKTRTNATFVLKEQMRNMKESMVMARA